MIKNAILVNRRKPVPVIVPEWDGMTIYLVPLSLSDLFFLEQSNRKEDHGAKAFTTATALVRHIVDADGERIFDDADHQKLIDTQPAALLANLFAKLAEISQPQAESAEKNSANNR